ncbi:unnamed protein product [Strongylus vulgaris]|uniref:7TM GPCR serpentine receptor class x (Srx) domain-containing protein n=1 Tax=Strongylus vulgaris TaxID=40348 RepID=A0A3P7J4G8_STRVU|nr:unnamed protein product [Strongylus vulgaris]
MFLRIKKILKKFFPKFDDNNSAVGSVDPWKWKWMVCLLFLVPFKHFTSFAITGKTYLSDVIVGCAMMILSFACLWAYSVILRTIWKDGEMLKMVSYKLMFLLGIFDVIQCFPHFITGIFTVCPSIYSPGLAKAMGVLATPAYVAYTMLTIILSFNRFIQIYSSELETILFSRIGIRIWVGFTILVWLIYAFFLASPWATIMYFPDAYSWDYDYTLKLSYYVQKCEMVIELSTILISAVFYIFVVIALYRTRKRFVAAANYSTEVKILIQALVITVYCTVLNFLWHNPQVCLKLKKKRSSFATQMSTFVQVKKNRTASLFSFYKKFIRFFD